MDSKKQLVEQLVRAYYKQVEAVKSLGQEPGMTLREYLISIFEQSPDFYTESDLNYGLSLERK